MSIIEKAKDLQSKGFTHMAAVVKSHYGTTYYNVQAIADVLAAGRWIPARIGQTASGARCRIGVSGQKIDWAVTARK